MSGREAGRLSLGVDTGPGRSGHTGGPCEAPQCHVPAGFDPEYRKSLETDVARFVSAARWLALELEEERGCHAALLQVSVLQADHASAAAFRQALEARLVALSRDGGLSLVRLRKSVAFDRLLARLFAVAPEPRAAGPT